MGMIGRTYSFAKWCHFYSRLFSLVTATGRVHGYSIGAFIYAPGLPVQRDWQLHDERVYLTPPYVSLKQWNLLLSRVFYAS